MAQVLCPELVGRDRELEVLTTALEEARAGRGTGAFLLGEAGMGKSRLAAQLAATARQQGCAVAVGRAVEAQGRTPFRPIAEALFSIVRRAGLPEGPDLAPFRGALGRLIPEWSHEVAVQDEASSVVLSEGVLRFLRALTPQAGLVLILEDLHWADPESLAVVEYLVANLDLEPMLCIGTLRTEQVSAGLTLIRSLGDRRTAQLLDLAALDDSDAQRMARSCLQVPFLPDGLAELIVARADGVPFLVEELLAAAMGCGALVRHGSQWVLAPEADVAVPVSFADTIRRRLSGAGEEATAVLRAAAILGRRFPCELLESITGLPPGPVLEALHRGVRTQLLITESEAAGGPTFRFRHALTRDAVLGELLPHEKTELARRALQAVEAAHPGLPGEWCDLAAKLSEEADDRSRAAQLLLEMGRRALARGALATAEATLERARSLAISDPAALLEIGAALTETLSLAGRTDQVFEVGEGLLAALEQGPGTAARRTQVHLCLARAAVAAGRWPLARGHIERARLLDQQGEARSSVPLIDAAAAQVAMGEDRLDDAVKHAEATLAEAERAQLPEAACEALEVLGRRARLDDLNQAEAAFAQARRLAKEHELRLWEIRALHELGAVEMLGTGRPETLLEARDLALQAGALSTAATIDLQLAGLFAVRFEPERALEHTQSCIAEARRYGLEVLLAAAFARLGFVHAIAERRTEMEAAFKEAFARGGDHPDVESMVWGSRGLLSLLEEERPRALRDFQRMMAATRASPLSAPGVFHALWALVETVEGPAGDAARNEVRSRFSVATLLSGLVLYGDALALGRQGRLDEAGDTFEAAEAKMQHFQGADASRQLARRLVAEAAIDDGWGAPGPWLREAGVFFEARHDRVASACRVLLRKAGLPIPRRGRGDSEVPAALRSIGVTSREVDVLALLGQRWGNAEIAARLYLSPRTVEKHIERLRQKTGTANRVELAAYAASVGVVPPGPVPPRQKPSAQSGTAGSRRAGATPARQRKTFMFTDIVRSTHLVDAIGDDAWTHLLRWHDDTLRSLFAAHRGEEVNRIGDGFFVAFDQAEVAVQCAVAIQRALARHRLKHGFAPEVRIGLHQTEAVRTGDDYQGKGVHEAARISAQAGAGEILASRPVFSSISSVTTSEPRPAHLKGIAQLVEVVSIEWHEDS